MIVKTFHEMRLAILEQVAELRPLEGCDSDERDTIIEIAEDIESILDFDFESAVQEAIQDRAEAEITALATAIAERRTHDAHEILQSLFPEIPLMHPSVTENLFPERIQK